MKGCVYAIVDNKTNLTYYGSTRQKLSNRIIAHKTYYKKYIQGFEVGLCTSFEILQHDDYSVKVIELVEFEFVNELYARERFWILNTPCVNKQIPLRTQKEYYRDNVEKWKLDYINNLEKKKRIQKEFCEKNPLYHKNYYQNNKEKILAYMNKNVLCECGTNIQYGNRWRHVRTHLHKKKMNM